MLQRQLRNRIEPWIEWVKQEPVRHHLVEAFALLDRDHKGYVTLEDLVARSQSTSFELHHVELEHFYAEAIHRKVGTEAHRHYVQEVLPRFSAQEWADMIAMLPEAVGKMRKPKMFGLIPDKLIESMAMDVTKELNHHLHEIGAAMIGEGVLMGLAKQLGAQIPMHQRS